MPQCLCEGCSEEVQFLGNRCPKHFEEFLDTRKRKLPADHRDYVTARPEGRMVGEVAMLFGVSTNAIGMFFNYKKHLRGYNDPNQWLNQPLLLQTFDFYEGIKLVEEDFNRQERLRQAKIRLALPARLRRSNARFVLPERGASRIKLAMLIEISGPSENEKPPAKLRSSLLNIAELSRRLGATQVMVRKWIKRGLIPFKEQPAATGPLRRKLFDLNDVLYFVRANYGTKEFAFYNEPFGRFLAKHNKEKART